jgi:LPXTG-motif cell wall-anchored protein
MPRGARFTVLLAAALGVTWLAAGPAAAVPADLRVTSATCQGVSVSAQGLPADQQLFLLVTDVSTGKALGGGPSPVHSTAAGEVHAQRKLSLNGVQTVDVSIWTKKGETLTMAAREKSTTNCAGLPMTGAASAPILVLGAVLLAAGAVLLWRTRGAASRSRT